MGRVWPLLAVLLGVLWLGQAAPGGWTLGVAAWQGPALALLLAGVFGVLHLSSNYLQARLVTLAWLVTRDEGRANRVYFTLMRPGVLVHEVAHALAATLVGGRILSFRALETTIVPSGRGRGQVRLGQVTYAIPGRPGGLGVRLKDACVGCAPLPLGILLVAAALALSGVDWAADLSRSFPAVLGTWQFWVALFALIEVADHMTPSAVDRKNWPAALVLALILTAAGLAAVQILALALPVAWWSAVLQGGLGLALVLAAPIGVNLVFGMVFWLLSRLFAR